MKKNKKIYIYFSFLFIVFCGVMLFKMHEDEIYVKKCYFENKQTFDDVADYFANCYEPSLCNIRYEMKTDECTRFYIDKSDTIQCNDSIRSDIAVIKNIYLHNSDYGCFSVITVYYDQSGNMQIIVAVKDRKHNVGSNEEKRCGVSALIYADDNYKGSDYSAFNHVNEKPISGNWYYWGYSSAL